MEKKSKSQRKREMLELQALGEQLVKLGPEQLKRIEMPEDLREAVLHATGLKRGEALRRQLQYIGALMRGADPEPIRKAVEDLLGRQRAEARLFQAVEAWRDRFLQGDDSSLEAFLERYPHADRQRLRQLVFNARKEIQANKPPKASRALFRTIRQWAASPPGGAAPASDPEE